MAQLERTPDPNRESTSKAAIEMDRAPRIVAIGRLGSPALFVLLFIIRLRLSGWVDGVSGQCVFLTKKYLGLCGNFESVK